MTRKKENHQDSSAQPRPDWQEAFRHAKAEADAELRKLHAEAAATAHELLAET